MMNTKTLNLIRTKEVANNYLFKSDLMTTRFILGLGAFFEFLLTNSLLISIVSLVYFMSTLYSFYVRKDNYLTFLMHGILGVFFWSSMIFWQFYHGTCDAASLVLAIAAWWVLVRYPIINKNRK